MVLHIGTSGWHYDEWGHGVFYPKGLPKDQWLAFYAQHFDTVEINNTFYRLPKTEVTEAWGKQVQDGFTDFDTAIATREMMGKVGRLGRILGPRGLMPNPRSGTVVAPEDIARTVAEAKKGRVEFRLDRLANIHVPLGKASFEAEKLHDNMATFIEAINEVRPDVKGAFIRSVTVTSTMGPAIGIDVNLALALKPA